jgi:hypothetical protein
MSDEDCDAIAEFIRSKGVTRCPTACVLPTQALVGAADRAALEEHAVTRDRRLRATSGLYLGEIITSRASVIIPDRKAVLHVDALMM